MDSVWSGVRYRGARKPISKYRNNYYHGIAGHSAQYVAQSLDAFTSTRAGISMLQEFSSYDSKA